ncbi:MAG: GIY-YIG nuclease family protein [Roseiarcus sp.]
MKDGDRRAARAAYKERKGAAGVYALRCAKSGEVWVGQALDLEKVWNRIAFTLRGGANPHRALQAAWNAHGAAAFAFEPLERLEEEALAFARQSALKERTAFWRKKLGAAAI